MVPYEWASLYPRMDPSDSSSIQILQSTRKSVNPSVVFAQFFLLGLHDNERPLLLLRACLNRVLRSISKYNYDESLRASCKSGIIIRRHKIRVAQAENELTQQYYDKFD